MLVAIDTSVLVAAIVAAHESHAPAKPWLDAIAIERCSARALKSGVIFDALHLIAAERSGAEVLLTFNPGDFSRLAQGERPKIIVPSAPPAELMATISSTGEEP